MGLAKLELPTASGKSDRTVPDPAYVHHCNASIMGEVHIPMGGMCAIYMLVVEGSDCYYKVLLERRYAIGLIGTGKG